MSRMRLCNAIFAMVILAGGVGVAPASDTLTIDGLPKDPRAYRTQVALIIKKADALIEKLKSKPEARTAVLDIMQTRDNILREISKVENRPDGAKWFDQEMRDSVDAMLKLLKSQYDKAAEAAG